MTASTSRRGASRIQERARITGALRLGGHDWPFVAYRQPLDLGAGRKVDYFYMLPSAFRGAALWRMTSNFRSCIGFWYAAMQLAGEGDDWDNQRNFVTAIAYALVNAGKGQQHIYLDAFPKPGSIRAEEPVLPEVDQGRIRRVVRSRDRARVKQELDAALGAYQPERGDLLGFQRAFAHWADKGVNSLRLQGLDGLESWLNELDYWLTKYRKRCPPRVRAFINFFAYEAKTSFYLCYANFWIGLIPWLREHCGLDELSERLLRVWHIQNQPIAVAHGRTAGGLYYPTHGRATLHDQASRPRQVTWKTPRIGPEYVPDVFAGQVLALHPLTWYLFADTALRHSIGRFFASPEFNSLAAGENTVWCPKYWNFIGAILAAANKYRLARDEFENQRSVRLIAGRATNAAKTKAASLDIRAFFEEYAAEQRWKCQCGGEYRYSGVDSSDRVDDICEVSLKCKDCGGLTSREVSQAEIMRALGMID